ncbi:hypothetical protein [uncultured Aurantimicrobium sp.]|uniref:hypothetical protein n=1 Tax=uncultured Aurantimicrobium sp. TaxID=1705357 RepID=UPI002616BBB5|nr:hypothetical protein [uncultured Aurantimicrobium sp.]
MNEFEGYFGFSPAGHSLWLALADALDAAVVTLHTAVPDPLWFGPSRYAFDHNAEQVMADLRQARWAVLTAEPSSS